MRKEYRAVFSGPNGTGSQGPPQNTMKKAMLDRPERPEETLQELTGVQVREVGDWLNVSLDKIMKEGI